MRYGWFAPLALAGGAVWAVRAWITTMDPTYWSPTSMLDYAAVALYSAGLITLALCIWRLRVVRRFAVSRGGAAARRLSRSTRLRLSMSTLVRVCVSVQFPQIAGSTGG